MSEKVYVLICNNWNDGKDRFSVVGVFSSKKRAIAMAENPDIMAEYGADLDGDAENSFEIYKQEVNSTSEQILGIDIKGKLRDLTVLNGLSYSEAVAKLKKWHDGITVQKIKNIDDFSTEEYITNNVRLLVNRENVVLDAKYH